MPARLPPLTTGCALFFVSLGITAHQIALMQILSTIQWYHFAYLVVAVALLGFGAAGTFFTLLRSLLLNSYHIVLPWLFLGCGAAMGLVLIPTAHSWFSFDLYLLFVEPSQFLRLTAACLIFGLPFFFGGLAIALTLAAEIDRVGFLYGANLTGSGLGGLLGLTLTNVYFPEQIPFIIALAPILSGIIFSSHKQNTVNWIASTFVVICCLTFAIPPAQTIPSQFKDISRIRLLPGAKTLQKKPSHHGVLQVVTANSFRQAPGISMQYQELIPKTAAILINGDLTGALPLEIHQHKALLQNTTEALGYALTRPESVLLLEPGGGYPINHAISEQAKQLLVVVSHPEKHRLLAGGVDVFQGYASHPSVGLIHRNPRTFLAQNQTSYDLIRFPTVGSFNGSVGITALREEFVLTRQAFSLAWQRLSPNGVLMISSWLDFPVKNPLRLLATLFETSEQAGIMEPKKHIAAIRGWGAITFVLSKSQLSSHQSAATRSLGKSLGFDPLLLPDITDEEKKHFHILQDDQFFQAIDLLLSDQRSWLYESYPFRIKPATDNMPYFSQFLRTAHFSTLIESFSLRQLPFFEMGFFILITTMVVLTALALLLILLPLFALGRPGLSHLLAFLYFSSLGLSYMMIEIGAIQNLTLHLGSPITSAATVFCALLIFSGIGSLFSKHLTAQTVTIRLFCGLAALSTISFILLIPWTAGLTLNSPNILRILIIIMTIAPIGFVMGIPFPLGLRFLNSTQSQLVPWALAINSCFSVIGPVVATVIALQSGLIAVFLCAGAVYCFAACFPPTAA